MSSCHVCKVVVAFFRPSCINFSDINYIPSFFQSSNPSTASFNQIWTPDGNYI